MTEYSKDEEVEYRGKTVGEIKLFGGYIVMKWYQTPLHRLSDEFRETYGMSIGLKEKIEESNIDYIEIDNSTVPTSVLDSYDTLSKNDDFFNSDISEDQILIDIPR